jgi:hypothetical protein
MQGGINAAKAWMLWSGHRTHHNIAYMDVGTDALSGTKNLTIHPEHKKASHCEAFIINKFTSMVNVLLA